MLGVVGHKCGMTRVFQEDGTSIPVSVIHVQPNMITQVKTVESDGYSAIQVSLGNKKRSKVNKAEAGHFAKAKVEPGKYMQEFRMDDVKNYSLGDAVDASIFEIGQKVDVTGTSKGKGFAGVIKRHNFQMQDATHGNSVSHRAHGSTGQCQDPGRVFKGKKMAGHMGNVRKTIQTLEVVRVDMENGLLLIKGAIPGSIGGVVQVMPTVKIKRG